MFSARNGASHDCLWLRGMTSWRVKVTSLFEKNGNYHLHIYTIWNYGKRNKTRVSSLEQRSSVITWRDSWQYVLTWHTWHGVEAWLPKHEVGDLTFSVCRCKWTGAMILLLFRTVIRSRDAFYLRLRDLHAWRETEGHVMVYVTYVFSVCICPTAMTFLVP